jgi:cell division protein FtsL
MLPLQLLEESMNRVHRLSQAYHQAPWRKQLQYIGLFLMALILVALVAGIYLSVTARAATVGRDIQKMNNDIEVIEREIEDLKTELALITSNRVMEERAGQLGFHPVAAEEMVFVDIPGYARPRQVTLALPQAKRLPAAPVLSDEYTQSLFEWLRERVFEPGAPLLIEALP